MPIAAAPEMTAAAFAPDRIMGAMLPPVAARCLLLTWPGRMRLMLDGFSPFSLVLGGLVMASNRGVAYMGPGKVEVQSIDFPKLSIGNRKCDHGVILKVVTTNICGSDQH